MRQLGIPEFTVLSDGFDLRRGSVVEQDLFDFGDRLSPMFDVLRHKDTVAPVSMALFGGAGTGKTTALRWLEEQVMVWNRVPVSERVGHPRVLPVWFAANDCPPGESGICRLISCIVYTCLKNLPEGTDQVNFLQLAIARCSGVFGEDFLCLLKDLEDEWAPNSGIVPKVSVSGSGRSGFGACAGFVDAWAAAWSAAGDPVRVTALVDDLDHCSVDCMMELLDAMAGRIRSPHITFVTGLDLSVTQKLIAAHFREHGYDDAQVRHYLGKVFQGECHIEPTDEQVDTFYAEQFKLLNEKTGQLLVNCLSADHKAAIDAAIMRLSGRNPRKIKLLLNSGAMKAYAASHQTTSRALFSENLFAQRIQIYLLQRWISRFGAVSVQQREVKAWFSQISEAAVLPDSDFYRLIATRQTQPEEDEDSYSQAIRARAPGDTYGETRIMDAPAGLHFDVIEPWIWELLKIPFNSDVTVLQSESVQSQIQPNDDVLDEETGEVLSNASSALLEALSVVLEKPGPMVVYSDLVFVEHLDFSGKQLEHDDLEIISQMENLKRLDLYNCEIKDLIWAKNLKELNRLNLTCTKVSDLSPLSELEKLQFLDLSYTAVSDLTPLSEMQHLEALVLYGSAVRSIEGLCGMKGLVRLNLSHTDVDDGIMDSVLALPSLQSLFLRGTSVSQQCAGDLTQNMNYQLQVEI